MNKGKDMTQTQRDEHNVRKGVMVGAAVLAGVVAAIALKDKSTSEKIENSLSDLRARGMELKKKAEKWAEDEPIKNGLSGLSEKNPVKKAARSIASA